MSDSTLPTAPPQIEGLPEANRVYAELGDYSAALFAQSPVSTNIFNTDGLMVAANRAWEAFWDSPAGEAVLRYNVFVDKSLEASGIIALFEAALRGEAGSVPPFYFNPQLVGFNGQARWLTVSAFPLFGANQQVSAVVLQHFDVTPLKEAEMRLAAQNAVLERMAEAREAELNQRLGEIEAQQRMIAELATPLLQVNPHTLVMPLIGGIDAQRAQDLIEAVLQGAAERQAAIVIIDITGVLIVDTHVATALLRAAQALKLLGARVVLTGIRPEIAQTLASLGVDLGDIRTLASLQDGINYAARLPSR